MQKHTHKKHKIGWSNERKRVINILAGLDKRVKLVKADGSIKGLVIAPFKTTKLKSLGTKYYYTYLITYSDGSLYHGKRSCDCLPEEDSSYWGSSKYTPRGDSAVKQILELFDTWEELGDCEDSYHREYDVANNDKYHNRMNGAGPFEGIRGSGAKSFLSYSGDAEITPSDIGALYNTGIIDSFEMEKMLSNLVILGEVNVASLEAFGE